MNPFIIYLNNKSYSLNKFSGKVIKNGIETKLSSSYEDGDVIVIERPSSPTLQEAADHLQLVLHHSIPVIFNGKKIVLQKRLTEIYRDEQLLQSEDILRHGESLKVVQKKIESFIFQDLFRHVELDLPSKGKSRFILLRNDKEIGFNDEIQPGDDLKVMWPATNPQT